MRFMKFMGWFPLNIVRMARDIERRVRFSIFVFYVARLESSAFMRATVVSFFGWRFPCHWTRGFSSKLNWTLAFCIRRVSFPMDFEDSAQNWIFVKLHNSNCQCGWTRFSVTVATIRIERQFEQPDQRWDYSLRHNLSVVSEGNQGDNRWQRFRTRLSMNLCMR